MHKHIETRFLAFRLEKPRIRLDGGMIHPSLDILIRALTVSASHPDLRSQASIILHDMVGQGMLDQSDAEHAQRLAEIVKSRGGTDRDYALCLLHEIPEGELALRQGLDPDLREAAIRMGHAMPDFFRDAEPLLMAKIEALLGERRPVHIIWLCDLQDTVRHEMVRLDLPEDKEERYDILKDRIDGALRLVDGFSSYKTLSLFLETVRSDLSFFSAILSRDRHTRESEGPAI